MLETVRPEKIDKKTESFVQFPCSFIEILFESKKSKSNRQFAQMHLKGLAMHFQEMALFIMLWLTVSEILGFEAEEFR